MANNLFLIKKIIMKYVFIIFIFIFILSFYLRNIHIP